MHSMIGSHTSKCHSFFKGHMVDDRLPPRKVLYTQMTVKEYVHKKMYKNTVYQKRIKACTSKKASANCATKI